jgi:S1-C subfamily serine protease|nr:trypsin-like peptidase domain-containing protein [Kofleriaceae bacterium]
MAKRRSKAPTVAGEPAAPKKRRSRKKIEQPAAAAAPTDAPPPPPDATPPPNIPVPLQSTAAAAALEAARIVSEIVDIDTPTGAVIAAAAAAGAAIQVVRGESPPTIDPVTGEEVSTVRLSRERILKAIEDDAPGRAAVAAVEAADAAAEAPVSDVAPVAAIAALEAAAAATPARAQTEPPARAQTAPPARAQTVPPVERAPSAPPVADRAQSAPPVPERAQSAPPVRAQTVPPVDAIVDGGDHVHVAVAVNVHDHDDDHDHVDVDVVAATAAAPTATLAEPAPADDYDDEELDPVALAAAAIQRLRARARTNVAGLRVQYSRHDLLVILAAIVIIFAAGRAHDYLVTPPDIAFPPPGDVANPDHGITFVHPAAWLKPEATPLPSPRLVHDIAPLAATTSPHAGSADGLPYHVELTSSSDPAARIEVLVDKKPAWSNIVTDLDLDRRTRWGELYSLDDSDVRSIEGHQWLRTEYRYAHNAEGDVPRVDHAVEYATIDRDQIYVVTLFGSPAELDAVEDVVAPSLRVATPSALPLVPQTGRLAQRTFPTGVQAAFGATVMVVVADIVDGKLKARGGGSGVVVGRDGSILTNYHVIHDKNDRLHDVFVIGRFSAPDRAPELECAGRPSRSKLQRELDLALVKCDLDLDGRAWTPSQDVWTTLPAAPAKDVHVGQRLWVLGYPDVGGGGLTLYQGQVEGWDGEGTAPGTDFIKTDASISNGNSGGPVVDDSGRLVGIASAYRTKVTASGGFVKSAQVGLVRPIAAAADLLNIAIYGWTPREGHTGVDIAPDSVEPAATGVRISTRILDTANLAPIRDALVMVLRPGVGAAQVDVNALDDQVLSWGRSNANGDVLLKAPVPNPGEYTVMVTAKGYEPLIVDNELQLGSNTPPAYDPWGQILLHAR